MATKQQKEALDYFNENAHDWRSKAEGDGRLRVNIINQRNEFVLRVADERQVMNTFLDVGCGTGELVCEMALKGIASTGIDYAGEMIDLASKKAADAAVDGANFICSSIFDVPIQKESYDLISANGFIEYISLEEMVSFFKIVSQALVRGGSFVVGSRNRLFNIFSMNDYLLMELGVGAADHLLKESIALAQANDLSEVLHMPSAPLQEPDTEHAKTGIGVSTRFQYTPLQLIKILKEKGLSAEEVYPAHIHGVPPAFRQDHPETHASIANLLQNHARGGMRFLPQASSFMLHVRKD